MYLQLPFSIYTPSFTLQILHFQLNLDGQYTHQERSLVGWASVHDPKRGDLQILTKITLWVALLNYYDSLIDGSQGL